MTQGFPEDYHQGSYSTQDEGDDNDAASFAAHNYASLPAKCIITGCDFTSVDYGAPSVDISAGTVRLVDTNVDGYNKTWNDGAFVYEIDGQNNLTLTDGTVNHVYVEANFDSPDSVSLIVNTTGTPPSEPYIKLGEVDTSGDTASAQWSLLAEDGTLTFPDESAADAVAPTLSSGTTVYDRGADTYWRVA